MSTNVLAAGCTMSSKPRIVAPSLEIVTFSVISFGINSRVRLLINNIYSEVKESIKTNVTIIYHHSEVSSLVGRRVSLVIIKITNVDNKLLTSAIHNEFVHASGTQSGTDSFHYHLTSVDVAHYLRDSLGSVSSLLQQDDSGLLRRGR